MAEIELTESWPFYSLRDVEQSGSWVRKEADLDALSGACQLND
jgi:hypothetical protein